MGAYICTISERDWEISRKFGVYGNRFDKKDDGSSLKDTQKLSVIRDLISIKKGDLIFFHVKGDQTIHGVYSARSCAIWDTQKIWNDINEVYPCRFLFEPHPEHKKLCLYDAQIAVSSLYELIDQGSIRSLVTLENEQNIEARAVKRIFTSDAEAIIRLLYRDFKKIGAEQSFKLYSPQEFVLLKDKLCRVGDIENAIKAVISWKLAYGDSDLKSLGMQTGYDFANEYFVAPTTRKNIDFLCESSGTYAIIEVKTDQCDEKTLKQALYYSDLIDQRPWANKKFKKIICLIGKRFTNKVKEVTTIINSISYNSEIRLIKYVPNNNKTWASLRREQDVQTSLL